MRSLLFGGVSVTVAVLGFRAIVGSDASVASRRSSSTQRPTRTVQADARFHQVRRRPTLSNRSVGKAAFTHVRPFGTRTLAERNRRALVVQFDSFVARAGLSPKQKRAVLDALADAQGELAHVWSMVRRGKESLTRHHFRAAAWGARRTLLRRLRDNLSPTQLAELRTYATLTLPMYAWLKPLARRSS